MKYVWTTLMAVLLCVMLLVPATGAVAEETTVYGVSTDTVNVRKTAGYDGALWFEVEKGHVGEILGTKTVGGKLWYQIETTHPVPNGRTYIGYVVEDFFRTMTAAETEAYLKENASDDNSSAGDEEDTDVVDSTGAITADGVNFRIGPGKSYGTMGKLDEGTVVELLTIPANIGADYWYKVRYNGQTGYIQSTFIRVLTVDESNLPDPSKYGYAQLKENNVNLRDGAGGETVVQVNKGTLLQIVGTPTPSGLYSWYPVYYAPRNTILYVREDMIEVVMVEDGEVVTPTPAPSSTYGYVITTTYGVNLRIVPGGESIAQAPRDTVLACVGDPVDPEGSDYTWYKVKYNGMTGYMRGDCVRVCNATGGSLTETPEPEPTEDPVEGLIYGYIRLTTYGVNLRVKPLGTSQAQLPENLILPMIGSTVPAGKYGKYCWYHVRTADGVVGYIRGDCATVCDPEGGDVEEETDPDLPEVDDLEGVSGKLLKNTNFRDDDSWSGKILTVIPTGTVVDVLSIPTDTVNGWYKIRYNGTTGYVLASLLTVVDTDDSDDDATPSSYGYVMITDNKVNLRDAAAGNTLTQLSKNTVWPMIGEVVTKNGVKWYPIRANGYSGYVHDDYCFKLSATQEESYLAGNGVPEETPAPDTVMTSYIITTYNDVNLRESYSLDSNAAAQVDKGTVMFFNGTKDVGTVTWYNIVYNGKELWVHGKYVEEMTQADYDAWLEANPDKNPLETQCLGYLRFTTDKVNVRSAANGSTVICQLNKGVVVRYYVEGIEAGGNTWYRILTPDGEFGYVNSNFLVKCDENGSIGTGNYTSAPQSQQETDYSSLSQGSTGYRVTNLVNELINQGYYDGAVTNTYTAAVKEAVKAFQTANGLTADGVAGDATQHKLFGTKPIGYGDTTNMDFAIYPVEKIDWYTGGIQQMIPRGAKFKIYDVRTGIVFWAYRQAGGRHMDIETLTAADSARLCQIYGTDSLQEIVDKNMWYPRRACLVTIGTRTFACSLDGMQHGDDTISNNNMEGQVCLHFTNSEGHSTQAVSESHAEAIEYAYNHCPAGQK